MSDPYKLLLICQRTNTRVSVLYTPAQDAAHSLVGCTQTFERSFEEARWSAVSHTPRVFTVSDLPILRHIPLSNDLTITRNTDRSVTIQNNDTRTIGEVSSTM